MLTFGYLRVSTHRQDLSIEAQTEQVKRAAQYHGDSAGLELFAEPDTSGSIEFAKREQGAALLVRTHEAIQSGLTVTVIVPKVDRLGRDVIDINQTVRLFEQMGARILFLDINVDTRTPMGRCLYADCRRVRRTGTGPHPGTYPVRPRPETRHRSTDRDGALWLGRH